MEIEEERMERIERWRSLKINKYGVYIYLYSCFSLLYALAMIHANKANLIELREGLLENVERSENRENG